MIRFLSSLDERIDTALVGRRYPPIESVRIIQQAHTPSAMVKIRRRGSIHGGPAVVRTYHVYSRKWVERWMRVQLALFKQDIA